MSNPKTGSPNPNTVGRQKQGNQPQSQFNQPQICGFPESVFCGIEQCQSVKNEGDGQNQENQMELCQFQTENSTDCERNQEAE